MLSLARCRALCSLAQSRTPWTRPAPPGAGRNVQRLRCVRLYAISEHAVPSSSLTADGSFPTWNIRMLYDGECPLCMKEVSFLQKRDAQRGKIDFVDITSDKYAPEQNAGLEYSTAMGEIHAILPDGTVVTKVEVFRRLYEQVGLGWIYAITKLPGIEQLANAVYNVWARYRLPLTGREDLLTLLENRQNEDEDCKRTKRAKSQAE